MRLLNITALLGACTGQGPSETRIIDERGGEVITLTNGVCTATVSSGDDEFNVRLAPSFCATED